MSTISNAMLLLFASGVPYGFRDRQRFDLVPKMTTTKMCKQSSQRSDQSCFCTNTRTTHTRQNKPLPTAWRGAGRSSKGTGRCCPATTVPVADVFPCGVCCCIAENMQNKIINRKTELCHHRPQTKAHSNEYENTHKAEQALLAWHSNEYENNTHKAEQALLAWRGAGRSSRGTKPLLSRYICIITKGKQT